MVLPSRSGALKIINYVVQRVRPSWNYLLINDRSKQCFVQHSRILSSSMYSSNAKNENCTINNSGVKTKNKKIFIPRITLLSETNELSVVTLEMAEKVAMRRNLKLVKIVDYDTKTERPTYKLMSTKDYIQEGVQRKTEKKSDRVTTIKAEKLLSISSKIAEHDLITKVKSVAKFLAKKHEVRILISADGNKEKAKEIATHIEKAVKDLPVQAKTTTSGQKTKIVLRPDLEAEKQKKENEKEGNKAELPVADSS